jgi:hypothetical protein
LSSVCCSCLVLELLPAAVAFTRTCCSSGSKRRCWSCCTEQLLLHLLHLQLPQ